MSSLSAFLKPNRVEPKPVKVAISDKYVDEKGNPILWQVIPVSAEDDKDIQKLCTTEERNKRTGQVTYNLDQNDYMCCLAARGTFYPDLTNKELQQSYGVNTATALLRKMLSVGELAKLAVAVTEVSGLNDEYLSPMEQDIETVKN